MKVIVGSINPAKVHAMEKVFNQWEVVGSNIQPNVAAQPIGEAHTRTGAIERALFARQNKSDVLGIGLEGGISFIEDDLYLCNWGALATEDNKIFTASGGKIQLPKHFKQPLLAGEQLGSLLKKFTKKEHIHKREGAIGVFTSKKIIRQTVYEYIGCLLYGQYVYWQENVVK